MSVKRIMSSALLALAPAAAAQDSISGLDFFIEPPTLQALGFEWRISGDDNRNASVEVAYRQAAGGSDAPWREGLPLLRVGGELVQQWDSVVVDVPHMFSGSLFDLAPDTAYEIRFTLKDPDGVAGEAVMTVTAATRPEPMPFEGGRVFHVFPTDHPGDLGENEFRGLMAAYFTGARAGDWNNTAPPRVRPGDTILVHAGVYRDNQEHYSHELISGGTSCCATTWDGTYYLTRGGTAEKPIAIKAAGDGEVIFDGNGNEVLFNVMAADHLYFEGITFRNTRHAILAGRKHITGSRGLVVKHSRFEDVGVGIHTDWSGSGNFYIADNVFIGRHDPDMLVGWLPGDWGGEEQPYAGAPDLEEKSKMLSYNAVRVYGAGHVIAHNEVRNFHDGINHATYGTPDDWPHTPRDRLPVSIDILNNDISNMHDNCIETDGALYNIRVMRNRCFNSATGALSFQPVMGGPAYFIRNVVYHALGGIIKSQANPAGILHYNNTYIGGIWHLTPASNLHYRNNLILGQERRPAVFEMVSNTSYSSSDYNGFRPNSQGEVDFVRAAPGPGKRSVHGDERVEVGFASLRDYAAATDQDSHSLLLDYDSFENLAMPALDEPTRLYRPEEADFSLRPDSPAVDAGLFLPLVNEGYTGDAPDLGALERGQPPPHYGPRPAPIRTRRSPEE